MPKDLQLSQQIRREYQSTRWKRLRC
jgi:hypothetical protein